MSYTYRHLPQDSRTSVVEGVSISQAAPPFTTRALVREEVHYKLAEWGLYNGCRALSDIQTDNRRYLIIQPGFWCGNASNLIPRETVTEYNPGLSENVPGGNHFPKDHL